MVKHTLKISQDVLQDFLRVFDHFVDIGVKIYQINLFVQKLQEL